MEVNLLRLIDVGEIDTPQARQYAFQKNPVQAYLV